MRETRKQTMETLVESTINAVPRYSNDLKRED